MATWKGCQPCDGNGVSECQSCFGSGQVIWDEEDLHQGIAEHRSCEECLGDGELTCEDCFGEGGEWCE